MSSFLHTFQTNDVNPFFFLLSSNSEMVCSGMSHAIPHLSHYSVLLVKYSL